VTGDARQRFEQAFIATLYLLGARGAALSTSDLGPEGASLARTLSSTDKTTRALALAREIARIGFALDRGALA
jgi:hypothetical protein